jgi:hypothetical protein
MQPDVQLQHKFPQVYLKPFGYKEHECWYISVLERNTNKADQMDISTFTAEQNAFDYSILPDIEDRRHFEKLCGKIEAQYPSIAKSVKKGSSLSEKP